MVTIWKYDKVVCKGAHVNEHHRNGDEDWANSVQRPIDNFSHPVSRSVCLLP